MKTRKLLMIVIIGLSIVTGTLFSTAVLSDSVLAFDKEVRAGGSGGTISGFVFGLQRQPVSDIGVELLDEFSRAVARTRTNAIGRYIFSGLASGRFKVRILAMDYEEQDVEIQSSYESAQKDFYLKPRREGDRQKAPEAIFVQEIPAAAREIYKKAVKLLDNKKEEEGLKNLKSALEIFPDFYDAIERLGTEYVKLKFYEAAEALLRRAVEINSRGYKSWYALAYAFYSQNKMKEALFAAERASSLNQFSAEPPFLFGVLLKRAGRFEEAEKQLKRAEDLSKGQFAEIHWQLALLYGNYLNRYAQAASELELFLKARADSRDAWNIKKLIMQFKEKAQK